MSIQFTCEHCNATHLVNDRFSGKRVRCPTCESPVTVPDRTQDIESWDNPSDDDLVGVQGRPAARVDLPIEKVLDSSSSVMAFSDQGDRLAETVLQEDEDEEPVLARKRRPEEEMDMTPMVDVTFLLLIFFMVTAAFSLQKSIEMPRQQTDAPSTSVQEEEVEELDMVELQVDEFGSFLVMAPEWERETPGKQNLISALKEAIAGNTDGMRLVVKVHEMAKLKSLVDAMDAGTIAGYAQLEVMQVEEFD
ncbi:biopolymer transporter ExbD [Rhodopirellula sp.]|jgi:biopolymer transport protein ExbD|nr:biopolymer transporter ExbD [Rhodopirellula sp.]